MKLIVNGAKPRSGEKTRDKQKKKKKKQREEEEEEEEDAKCDM